MGGLAKKGEPSLQAVKHDLGYSSEGLWYVDHELISAACYLHEGPTMWTGLSWESDSTYCART